MKDLGGEYIRHRWEDSEVKRRHYRQTEAGIRSALQRISATGDVLEIGSGPAVWTTLYLVQASSATLLDISQEMLEQARVRLDELQDAWHASKVRYECGDFLELALPHQMYDTIVSSRAFEYMSDKPAFVRKCLALLRPGGTLLLVTKNERWYDARRANRELRKVSRDKIPVGAAMQLDLVSSDAATRMFREAGFAEVDTYPAVIGSYHAPFSWPPGLALADALHRRYYRRSLTGMPRVLRSLVESFVALGRKPA
jgi:ubiquinone/menaquinone biosynthesis C-methylase UbiE